MQKILKFSSVFLALFLTITGIKTFAYSPPKINIDAPRNSSYITNSVTVKGWSLNTSGVKSVQVYVNGNKVGNAATGIKRADVNNHINASGVYKGALYSGYSFTLGTSSYKPGTYNIKVLSTGYNGTHVYTTRTVKKAAPLINIDAPKSGINVSSNFIIKGWSVNPTGVNQVTVSVDGKALASAQIGINRSDVNNRINTSGCYPGAAYSGYTYTVPYESLTLGSHTVSVKSIGKDGSNITKSFTINVIDPNPIAYIDTPRNGNGYLRDTLAVSGWSVSASDVKKVEVYLDGNNLGSAAIGHSRPDVSKSLEGKGYKNDANSGFSFTAAGLENYKPGSHTVKVVSTGYDGKTAIYTSQVTKASPIAKFDTASKNMTVNNTDFTVSGWAVNATGIKSIELYCGSKLLGTSTTSGSSDDVVAAVDKDGIIYNGSAQARHTFNVDIDSVPHGKVTLVLHAIGKDGETYDVSTTVTVNKPAPIGVIDSPSNGENFTYLDKSITISGWTLNASGVKSISVYVDSTQHSVETGLASDSGIINVSGGNYKGDANARFTTGSIDISGLSYAKHTVKIVAVGNDGDTYTLTSNIIRSNTAYTGYSISLTSMFNTQNTLYKKNYDTWKLTVTSSNMDPNAILNADSYSIYEFMDIQYYGTSITAAQINKMLAASGKSNNIMLSKGQDFIDAANTYHINPVYLAAHAIHETGYGTSTLAQGQHYYLGKDKNGKDIYTTSKYYNMYGIGAYDGSANSSGLAAAYKYGWDTVDKAIAGGAKIIHDHYTFGADMGHPPTQNTLYMMKWDPVDVQNGRSPHEYATDPNWAHKIAYYISQNADIFDGYELTFNIPKYK